MKHVKRWAGLAAILTGLLAVAVPGIASAARLEHPKKTLYPVGSAVTLTSNNYVEILGGTTLKCKKVEFKGIVAKNSESTVVIEGTGTIAAERCEDVGLGEIKQTFTFGDLTGIGSGPGTLPFSFAFVGICEGKSTSSYVSWNGSNSVSMEGSVGGTCGSGQYKGSFRLETPKGVEVFFSS